MKKLFLRKKKTILPPPPCAAVILAAGASTRMGGTDKLGLMLGGIPVLAHTLMAFQQCSCITEIILVVQHGKLMQVAKICKEFEIHKARKLLVGGRTRTESGLIGVSQVSESSKLVAIHDGARPFVTEEMILKTVAAAHKHLAAAPGVPVKDTIKITAEHRVQNTPSRASLMAVQTPQVFEIDLIQAALTDAVQKEIEITDDCMAVELLGVKPCITLGAEENIKITTPMDLMLGEAILTSRRITNENRTRI